MDIYDADLLVRVDAVTGQQVGKVWKRVDVQAGTSFSFNLQVSDYQNPTAVLIPYSVQVSFPRTKRNNDTFSHIGKLDSNVFFTYNPLLRTDFVLFVAGSVYQSGYLKVESVTEKEYKVRLYGGLGNFFYDLDEVSNVRDMRLKSLDFGGLFDHVINKDYVSNCWTSGGYLKSYFDYASGTTVSERVLNYAMTYQGAYDNFDAESVTTPQNSSPTGVTEATWVDLTSNNKVYAAPVLNEHRRNMLLTSSGVWCGEYRSYYQRPAIKLKCLYNRIIATAAGNGWTVDLDTSFFNDTNPYWNNLWVLCPQYNIEDGSLSQKGTWAGADEADYWPAQSVQGQNVSGLTGAVSIPVAAGAVPTSAGRYRIVSEINLSLLQIWQEANAFIGFTEMGYYKKGSLEVQVILTLNGVDYPYKFSDTGDIKAVLDKDSTTKKSLFSEMWSGLQDPVDNPNKPSPYPQYNFLTDKSYDVTIGEHDNGKNAEYASKYTFRMNREFYMPSASNTVQLRVQFTGDTNMYLNTNTFVPPPSAERTFSITPMVMSGSSIHTVGYSSLGIRSNTGVTYADMMKSDRTAFDFMMSYGKIFGLYYVKDEATKTVHIMTRNTFYGAKEKVDWTQKIDYSKEVLTEPVPFTYGRGVFKWNGTGSKYENQYLNTTSREYGSAIFDTGYQFSDDVKDYLDGIMFNNAVVASDYSQYYLGRDAVMYRDNKILPHFQDGSGEKVDTGYILFFYNGTRSVNNPFLISDDDGIMYATGYCWTDYNGVSTNAQPYFSRIYGSGTEARSLNFGRPSKAYNDDELAFTDSLPVNGPETLYSRFWKGYINDVFNENNRKMTCYVRLNMSDVNGNIFRKFIFIENTAWVVDSIHGFDPLSEEPVKVTLMKVRDINNYVSQNY